jgi:hypothetical protein
MTTNTEYVAAEELVVETTEQAEQIELSLSELDMVGGGSVSVIF